ncbi:MAG: type II toxin-antitoxin system HigB family toxin [Acidobacteria bacterium]|nr:type II toxin-antitoxin system HigB family toxin [Acidobacteriota bacterium]
MLALREHQKVNVISTTAIKRYAALHADYYRLIVKVDYRARLLMVKEFLTHNEYMRGGWKKWAR